MSQRTQTALLSLGLLFVLVIMMVLALPLLINLFAGAAASVRVPYTLPSDICVIDGKMLTPQIDIGGYGNSPGVLLKYINTNGDLVLLVENKIRAIYTGDFCQ